jgi:glutaredoxin-like protein
MAIISENDREIIKKELADLSGKVKLINFTQEIECQFCRETKTLLTEISELSDKTGIEIYNFITDSEMTNKYKIDKIPATVIMGEDDKGIRFYGIPSGYEFVTLLDTIKMVSAGQSGLGDKSREFLAQLKKPVHLQVFITPT